MGVLPSSPVVVCLLAVSPQVAEGIHSVRLVSALPHSAERDSICCLSRVWALFLGLFFRVLGGNRVGECRGDCSSLRNLLRWIQAFCRFALPRKNCLQMCCRIDLVYWFCRLHQQSGIVGGRSLPLDFYYGS